MNHVEFEVVDAFADRRAASPTMKIEVRMMLRGERADAVALQAKVYIEPEPPERSLLWTQTALLLQDCDGDTVFQIPVPCSYDLRVASSRYLAGLDGGPIPLRIVFNGTVFRGAQVEHLPEDIECKGRLSTQTWREAMDACFPDHAWIRVDRETFEALRHYAVDRELYGSSEVISDLLRRSRVGQT